MLSLYISLLVSLFYFDSHVGMIQFQLKEADMDIVNQLQSTSYALNDVNSSKNAHHHLQLRQ